MTDEFKDKFRIEDFKVLDFKHWILSVRPQQPTIGSMVISLKRTCKHLGEIYTQEAEELSIVFARTERILSNNFKYDKINYLCLMMVDEQVHFHIIPRYSTVVQYSGKEFIDKGWPGPPMLDVEHKDDDLIVNKIQKSLKKRVHIKNKIVGYTTGVFDLFHVGHLNILKNAKANCDYLIVGVTTDELAEKRKGKKPVISLNERMEILNQINYSDKVVIQDSMDKFVAWEKHKFDKMFVGGDWKGTDKWNKLEVEFEKLGVEIIYFPYTKTTSSTILREALKKLA